MARVLVIGSANMDVVAPLRRLPAPGETLLIDDVRLVPGGKGANAAVAAARMGSQVRFIGCVGSDAYGQVLRDGLVGEGINCEHLQRSDRGSGTAVILLNTTDAQNAIMVGPGANEDIVLPVTDEPFAWADLMMLQLETPIDINLQAIGRARSNGVKVVLDPAPAATDLPEELLRGVDIISPNESELATLTGMRVGSVDEVSRACACLTEKGVREIVVKLGAKGALWFNESHRIHFSAIPVQAVDTTAAGDAFTGAMSAALADGMDMHNAIERACVAGALACTRIGAQPSLPNLDHVEATLRGETR